MVVLPVFAASIREAKVKDARGSPLDSNSLTFGSRALRSILCVVFIDQEHPCMMHACYVISSTIAITVTL